MKYLDPKNDLTFRKIFGERPHLLISFLNSLLPLKEGQIIESIEYLEPEIIPELPNLKRSIVDVRCMDNHHRQFIVEMQMYWTSAFKQRMLFNTGKAYVRQLKGGSKYRELRPVYGLSLVDDIFHHSAELKDIYYHHYHMVHNQVSHEQIEGLELVFVELPKFQSKNFTDKRMSTLWLRFLTEINEDTRTIPDEMMDNTAIREALECIQKEAFSEEELLFYDNYWDAIRVEKAALDELEEQNQLLIKEKAEALEDLAAARKGLVEAQKREAEAQTQKENGIVKLFVDNKLSISQLSSIFLMTEKAINDILWKHNIQRN
jgi:predicted transposase/invertase (TIGR01784 family)